MKKVPLLILLASLLISISFTASAQKTDLNGKWRLDRAKTQVSGEWPLLAVLTIKIKGDSLYTERTYEMTDGQQYPFTEALTLDNKEHNMTIYEMPRKIKAIWSAPESVLNFESTTTFYGSTGAAENFVSKEVWKADKAAKTLTISFTNKTSAGESTGTIIFNKE